MRILFIFTAMSTAVLHMSDLPGEAPQSTPRNARSTIHHSHERALSALEPLNFPSITSLPPVPGWSSTTLDVDAAKKAIGNLVTIQKDTDYPGENFYRCNGLALYEGGFPIDGCGHTEDDALMAYMQTLMQFDPANFMKNGKRLEWIADYRQFHELGKVT